MATFEYVYVAREMVDSSDNVEVKTTLSDVYKDLSKLYKEKVDDFVLRYGTNLKKLEMVRDYFHNSQDMPVSDLPIYTLQNEEGNVQVIITQYRVLPLKGQDYIYLLTREIETVLDDSIHRVRLIGAFKDLQKAKASADEYIRINYNYMVNTPLFMLNNIKKNQLVKLQKIQVFSHTRSIKKADDNSKDDYKTQLRDNIFLQFKKMK